MTISSSEIIATLSLLVSIIAIIYARASSVKANTIAQENLKIQQGIVELEISQSIENAKSKVNEISIIMAPLKSKEDHKTINSEDAATLETYRKTLNAAIQSMLNCYDSACSKYIDGKVDKVRFKKTYKTEIRRLLESDDLKEYFNPLTSSYKPILSVYSEWEDLERQPSK